MDFNLDAEYAAYVERERVENQKQQAARVEAARANEERKLKEYNDTIASYLKQQTLSPQDLRNLRSTWLTRFFAGGGGPWVEFLVGQLENRVLKAGDRQKAFELFDKQAKDFLERQRAAAIKQDEELKLKEQEQEIAQGRQVCVQSNSRTHHPPKWMHQHYTGRPLSPVVVPLHALIKHYSTGTLPGRMWLCLGMAAEGVNFTRKDSGIAVEDAFAFHDDSIGNQPIIDYIQMLNVPPQAALIVSKEFIV